MKAYRIVLLGALIALLCACMALPQQYYPRKAMAIRQAWAHFFEGRREDAAAIQKVIGIFREILASEQEHASARAPSGAPLLQASDMQLRVSPSSCANCSQSEPATW